MSQNLSGSRCKYTIRQHYQQGHNKLETQLFSNSIFNSTSDYTTQVLLIHSSVHCSTRPRALIVRYFRQMQSNEHAMMQSNTDLEHRFVYVS